jgi:hypothetical protein
MMCQGTPAANRSIQNPFNFMPETPSVESRVNHEATQSVLDNLDALYAPSIKSAEYGGMKIQMKSENHTFNVALQRMRQGDALRRLRKQQEERINNGNTLAEKIPLSTTVGMQPQQQRGRIARSA